MRSQLAKLCKHYIPSWTSGAFSLFSWWYKIKCGITATYWFRAIQCAKCGGLRSWRTCSVISVSTGSPQHHHSAYPAAGFGLRGDLLLWVLPAPPLADPTDIVELIELTESDFNGGCKEGGQRTKHKGINWDIRKNAMFATAAHETTLWFIAHTTLGLRGEITSCSS